MYEILPTFEQDTPEWFDARMQRLGASEVAAVLGLSKWQTPYGVYKTKMGIPNTIDPDLAYFGHRLEPVIAGWVRDKHPEVGRLIDGFSAVNPQYPWIAVSPDRFADTAGLLIPVELKTSSAFNESAWKDGVPLYYQAQVQAQLLVFDAPYGWLAVLHGGNKPALHRIERDDDFLFNHLIPKTGQFWQQHVVAKNPPDPSTIAEVYEVWPSAPGTEIEASDEALEAAERRVVLLSDIKAQTEEADALTLAIAQYMGTAETLVGPEGPVLTYKSQNGRRSVDIPALEADFPDVAAQVIRAGNPFKTMRMTRKREIAHV
jgi:putative phage-type endonuclease